MLIDFKIIYYTIIKIGWCFVWELAAYLARVQAHWWNVKWLIVFQMVILQHTHHMLGAQAIWRRLLRQLNTWEDGQHHMMVKDTMHTWNHFLTASCWDDTEDIKIGWCFVWELAAYLARVQAHWWNVKWLIVFQMVILQHTHHMLGAQAIWRRLLRQLNTWEDGQHHMMVKDTMHTWNHFLTASCWDDTEDQRWRTYTSLVLHGKLRAAVWWITDR